MTGYDDLNLKIPDSCYFDRYEQFKFHAYVFG